MQTTTPGSNTQQLEVSALIAASNAEFRSRYVGKMEKRAYRFSILQAVIRLVLVGPGFLLGGCLGDLWFVASHPRPVGGGSFEAWIEAYRACQLMGATAGAALAMALPSAVILFVYVCWESDQVAQTHDTVVESRKFTARVDLACLLAGAALAVLFAALV